MSSSLVSRGLGAPNVRTQADRSAMRESAGARLALIAESFARLAGKPLVDLTPGGFEEAMWHAPRAIVAYGIEPEPRFFYGNRVALEVLAMTSGELIGTIANRLGEPVLREEQSRMIAGLARHDIVDMYAVVGLAANGRRYAISNAQLWNLVDRHGGHHGRAATFADWQFLDRS